MFVATLDRLHLHTAQQPPNGARATIDARSGQWAATSERHRAILRLLAERGGMSVAEISVCFTISAATARRDIASLAAAGKALRRRGRLIPAATFRGEQHFRARSRAQVEAKVRIAQRAAQLLPHDGTVFVDAGTTCLEVARLLIVRPNLRIVTNSIPLMELAPRAQATVVGIGGEIRKTSLALTGALLQPWLASLRFDVAVVGAAGVDLPTGAYTSEIHEAAIKAEVLRRSVSRMLVADADKWNRPTAVHFAPWSAFTIFVTNHDLAREARLALASNNVALHLANQFVEAA